jgi:phosphatidylserine/phosphatidylglycerophosphate/cardiolipin synthase-like enzyme
MRLWVFKRHFSTIFQLYIALNLVGRESGYLKIFFYISRGEHVKHFVIDAYLKAYFLSGM